MAGCSSTAQDITQVPEDRLGWLRKRAAIVFQDPFSSLNPYMTVSDLVAEPLVIDGVNDADARRARVRAALEAVDLTPTDRFMHAYPTSMSGGQRQRVGIARALIRNPEYIVADEPVSMVDASSRVEILDLLNGLQQQRGVAFLYITHDIASARHFADRIAVMHLGSIVESGSARAGHRPAGSSLHPRPHRRGARARPGEPLPPPRHGALAGHPRLAIHPGCPHGGSIDEPAVLLEVSGEPGHSVACHLEPARAR